MASACTACSSHFTDSDELKLHYRSNWHRYNVQLKVKGIAPLSLLEFDEKMSQALSKYSNNNQSNIIKSITDVSQSLSCNKGATNGSGESETITFTNTSETEQSDSDWQSFDEEYEFNNTCMFCEKNFKSFDILMKHLHRLHSFYIPDCQYVSNITELIRFMYNRVHTDRICIYCDNHTRYFKSVKDVQKHMRDLCHCRLDSKNISSYQDFFDYTKSYPDEFEEGSNDNIVFERLAVDEETFELILPDSRGRLGHRDLKIYFKQRINDNLKRYYFDRSHPRFIGDSQSKSSLLSYDNFKVMNRQVLDYRPGRMILAKTNNQKAQQKYFKRQNPM